ncbi:prolipoprotein diacylglyceryl transferase [bacterium]|nr:prolipoprotein diacylglyceryl transferase [bacterium]MCB2179438.1 prolipoprotein diacylglyceryl transferase [bacterium]
MMPYLNLFGVAIAFPPLIIIIGIWLGASLTERHAKKFKLPADVFYNLLFLTLVAFALGGRLGYAIQHPAAFIEDPISLLSRNFGLFDLLSGVMIALLAAAIYGQRKHLSLWPTLDAITPLLAVLMIAWPLANLASGSAYGAPSSLPWAIDLWGENRHPVQLYEVLGAAAILYALWPAKYKLAKPGMYFFTFIGYSAFARLFFEGFRGSSPVTLGNVRVVQIVALAVLAAVLWQINRLRPQSVSQKQKSPQ